MTPEQLHAYATDLIQAQAGQVDYLAIFECAEESEHVFGDEISEDDAAAVADLIQAATVTITWDETGEAPE